MKLGVFYHCKISGEGIPNPSAANLIVAEQMAALRNSGLAQEADVHVGINGSDLDAMEIVGLLVENAKLHVHGNLARWEFPTLRLLQQWSIDNPNSAVFYHHGKGVTNPEDEFRRHHRREMERFLVWNWRECVYDLQRGYEAVGINLVDPISRPVLPGRYFAGNFWWAQTNFVAKLAPIPSDCTDRIFAEGWLLSCPGPTVCLDYERPDLYKHWEHACIVRRA